MAYPASGSRQRRLDGLRVQNPPLGGGEAYCYGPENRSTIWKLLENHPVEVIEVHGWGFHAFGQVLGKAEILQKVIDPMDLSKTVITTSEWQTPSGNSDPATEAVYENYDIDWVVLD